jgi:hypothetical protein
MRTILAHWKKDLRSTQVLLIVWLLCAGLTLAGVISLAIPGYSSSFLRPSAGAALAPTVAFLTGLVGLLSFQYLLAAILIVRIVHLDSLIDPNAWWRTRPISGLGLLGAKGLSVAMLLLGNCLCLGVLGFEGQFESGFLLSCSFTGVVFVTGLVAFASFTKDLSALILNWIAVVVGASILARFVGPLLRDTFLAVQGSPSLWNLYFKTVTGIAPPPLWLSFFCLAGFLAAAFCQYLKRSTNGSRAILFATFFLAILIGG